MSPPIRDGSGNSIGSIRLGDGSEIAEVRTGAGDVLFRAAELPDSAIARYRLEQDFTDSIGTNDGTGKNNPTFTSDSAVGGFAIDLAGSAFVEIGTPTPLQFTANDAFSISAWIEADQWDGPNGRSHWVSSRNGNSNFTQLVSFNNSDLRWSIKGNSNNSTVGINPPATGSYNLFVGTYDGAGTVELFLNDGNSQGTDTASLSGDLFEFWNIGQRDDSNRVPDGRIDDVVYYNEKLTASQVSGINALGP